MTNVPVPERGALPPRPTIARAAIRVLLHLLSLVLAIVLFAAYFHFKVAGSHTASLVCLVLAAGFALTPLRDLARVFFAVEGKALHLAHAVGGLALVALPLMGFVSGQRVLSRVATAPFAIMGAAQAMMHQNQPRNAQQASAMQAFAQSLPEIAQFAGTDLSNPQNAERAIQVLTDIVGKAQALGQTELAADPQFQSALQQSGVKIGTNLGLDAVDVMLDKLAQDPATAKAVPLLKEKIASVRAMLEKSGAAP